MEKAKYDRLVKEIVNGVDRNVLKEVMATDRKDRRVDMELMMIRDSVWRSSLGVYKGEMYHFGGRKYDFVGVDDFGNVLYDVMRKLELPMGDFSKIESVIRVCRRMVSSKELKVNSGIMVFGNCIYDMKAGKKRRFSRDYVQISSVDYDYVPGAVADKWNAFLIEVLPNKVLRMVLQEFIGSIFINRAEAKMESMMVLIGCGANGKSVIFETVMGLLGRDNVTHFSLDELIGMGVEKKRNIATMNGRRLNYASETGHFVMDGRSGVLKALISGEPVEARAMYGDNFTARELPMLMINCNRMPELKDFSRGLMRRLTMIPFNVEIPLGLQNTELSKELEDEYPGIFNWAMEGRRRFIENGYKLTSCEILNSMVEDYQTNGSSILEFMRNRMYFRRNVDAVDIPPVWKNFSAIYDEYHSWAIGHNEVLVSYRDAASTLVEFGFQKRKGTGGMQFAIFGSEAVLAETRRRSAERVEAEIAESDEVIAGLTQADKKNIRRRFARVCGWNRTTIGLASLGYYVKKATGVFVDIQHEMKSDRLEGMYQMYNRAYVFNLDLIDNMWLPEYTEKLRRREQRRELKLRKEKEAQALNEYKMNIQFNENHKYTQNEKREESEE